MADATTGQANLSGSASVGGRAAPQSVAAGRYDKLSICNQALINTSSRPVVNAEDGTDEWTVASSAFDQWLDIRMDERTWNWATILSGPLQRTGDSCYPGYGDVFAKPTNCLFLANIWRADLASLIQPAWLGTPSREYDNLPPALDYKIIGDAIHTTAANSIGNDGSPAQTTGDFKAPTADDPDEFLPDFLGGGTVPNLSIPGGETSIIALYVPFPTQGQPWSVLFVASLRLAVEAQLLASLNEDMSAAMQRAKMSEDYLEKAIARDEQQEPRKVAFRSHLIERRRGRYYGGGAGGL